jgi:hypothetical protein
MRWHSDVFVKFIEDKFAEHRVKKIVPQRSDLEAAYRLFVRCKRLRSEVRIIEEAHARDETLIPMPTGIESRVLGLLSDNPEITWDDAVRQIANELDGEARS